MYRRHINGDHKIQFECMQVQREKKKQDTAMFLTVAILLCGAALVHGEYIAIG